MDDATERSERQILMLLAMAAAGTLDNVQERTGALFAAVMKVTSAAGVALFDISLIVALTFYLLAMISAMRSGGGGALLETIAGRLFILFALTAIVNSWQPFSTAIRDDIVAFAGKVSQTNAFIPGAFTPSSIIDTNSRLTDAIYASGEGGPFALLNIMTLWKVVSVTLIQIGSAGLALDLFLANISLDIVFAGCAMLIGLIVSPWLQNFAMQYVGLIVGTAVYIILIGVFVSVGEAIAAVNIGIVDALPKGSFLPGQDMLYMGVISVAFAVMAWVVPAVIAGKIAGGAPLFQAASLLNSAFRGLATFR